MPQALRYYAGHLATAPAGQCYNRLGAADHRPHSPARLFSMFRSRHIATLLVILTAVPALLWAAPQKLQRPHTVRVKASAQRPVEPVAAQPAPPVPPPTLEQMPAQAPQVSFLNGQLTIISRNSTLGDILHAVARQTGAVIELPPGAGFERVAGRMGPGPARNVLAELLNGSRYDYVMIASATNPGGLQHVILTPKTGATESPSPQAAYQPPPSGPQVMPNQDQMAPDPNDDAPPDELPAQDPNAQDPNNEPPQASSPEPPPGQQPAGVKTPEQLLQELQRMQQQQQQQQQQQNPQP